MRLRRSHLAPLLAWLLLAPAVRAQNPQGASEPPLRSSVIIRVKDLGAVGNGAADDTAAFQAAIDKAAAKGGEILVDPGNYKITKTLHWINPANERAPGIWLVGAGYLSTHLLSYVQNGPLIQVRGVPSKGPVNTTFFWGGGMEGLDLVGAHGAPKDHDALDVLGWYFGHIRNCRFTGFSRNGITGRVDLGVDSNPDFTSSELTVEDTTFERLGGWGYYGASIGNPGWTWTHCLFNFCAQGAALVLSASHTFDTCSFSGSGYISEKDAAPGEHAHIEIGQLHGSIARIVIRNCEFDFVKTAHLFVNSLASGDIRDNRFIFRSWESEDVVPKSAIVIAPAGPEAAVQGVAFSRNVFRVDGRGGNVSLYEWRNVSNVQNITISGSVVSDQAAGKVHITRYAGYDRSAMNTRQNYVISDDTVGWVSKGKWPPSDATAK